MSKEQKLEELRKKLFQLDEKEFNQLLNDSFNITQKQVDSQYRQLSKNDFLYELTIISWHALLAL
jgi:hypothetical protein